MPTENLIKSRVSSTFAQCQHDFICPSVCQSTNYNLMGVSSLVRRCDNWKTWIEGWAAAMQPRVVFDELDESSSSVVIPHSLTCVCLCVCLYQLIWWRITFLLSPTTQQPTEVTKTTPTSRNCHHHNDYCLHWIQPVK